jgi:hypothetical protein
MPRRKPVPVPEPVSETVTLSEEFTPEMIQRELRARLVRIARFSPDDRAALEAIKLLRDVDGEPHTPSKTDTAKAAGYALFSLPFSPQITTTES